MVEMWMGGIKAEEEGIKEERGLGSNGRWASSVASLLLLVGHLTSEISQLGTFTFPFPIYVVKSKEY